MLLSVFYVNDDTLIFICVKAHQNFETRSCVSHGGKDGVRSCGVRSLSLKCYFGLVGDF